MTKDEALKLALEALNKTREYQQGYSFAVNAAKEIDKALAQPEQEPVEVCCGDYHKCSKPCTLRGRYYGEKLTPKRPWVGLTAEEAAECWTTSATQTWKNFQAKLKEKNT